jgi:hypothetical protein
MAEPIKPKKKSGQYFFLALIAISGVLVFSLLFLAFEGDKVTSYTIEKFVLDGGVFEKALSDEIDPEEKRAVVLKLHQFFERAKSGTESKERIALIGGKLREILEDHRITREEAAGLEELLKESF